MQRRHKSKGYKAWLKIAKDDLECYKYYDGFAWKNHIGKVAITIWLKAPDNRLRDCANYEKAIVDFLVEQKVIAGDDFRFVRKVTTEWKDDVMTQSGAFVIIQDIE